jgi:hypothetical protein
MLAEMLEMLAQMLGQCWLLLADGAAPEIDRIEARLDDAAGPGTLSLLDQLRAFPQRCARDAAVISRKLSVEKLNKTNRSSNSTAAPDRAAVCS